MATRKKGNRGEGTPGAVECNEQDQEKGVKHYTHMATFKVSLTIHGMRQIHSLDSSRCLLYSKSRAHSHTVKNYKTREIGYFLVNITAVAYGTRIYFGGLYSLSNSAKHNDWKVHSPGTLPDLIDLLTFKAASCWVGTLLDLIHLLTFKSLLVVGWEPSLIPFISSHSNLC